MSLALALISVLLWTAIVLRALSLRALPRSKHYPSIHSSSILANFLREVERLKSQPRRLERVLERTLRDLHIYANSIKMLVAIAPLLGLLGTVIGMVEMFSSLHGASLYTGEITVAGGISKALLTTQLGLIIAAPGLVFSFMLNRKQLRREREAKEILVLVGQSRV